MARAVRIERFIGDFETAGTSGFASMAEIVPGETITKVVMQVSFTYFTNVLLEARQGGGLWGVRTLPVGESTAVLNPATDPQGDWMWWEGVQNRNYAFGVDTPQGDVDASTWPLDGGYRTIKAQRKADPLAEGTRIYFCHANINPAVIPWHQWVTASIFILEAE